MGKIKKLIPGSVKEKISNILYFFSSYFKILFKLYKNKDRKKIVLLEMPTYSNLGDQAIALAETKFFEEKFEDCFLIEISVTKYTWYKKALKRIINKNDLIALVGGGNFGDEYSEIENQRLDIIKSFSNAKIVIFPQTIFYSNTENGKNSLRMMKNAIDNHKNLLLITREQCSYDFAISNFSANVELYPDIVLFLHNKIDADVSRETKCLLCLRDDVEKKVSIDSEIQNEISNCFDFVSFTDTICKERFSVEKREFILNKKWREFYSSQLVVTDRLHGMIFSVITNTPCIALPNYNYKIRSFYQTWLKNIELIQFANDEEELRQLIKKHAIDNNYVDFSFESYFTKLENQIKAFISFN